MIVGRVLDGRLLSVVQRFGVWKGRRLSKPSAPEIWELSSIAHFVPELILNLKDISTTSQAKRGLEDICLGCLSRSEMSELVRVSSNESFELTIIWNRVRTYIWTQSKRSPFGWHIGRGIYSYAITSSTGAIGLFLRRNSVIYVRPPAIYIVSVAQVLTILF